MANEIIRTYPESLTLDQRYDLTHGNPGKISNMAGQCFGVKAAALFIDHKQSVDPKTGEVIDKTATILSIETDDGDVVATNSATFIASFWELHDFYLSNGVDWPAKIGVVSMTSKSGRTFYDCVRAR